MRNSSGPAGGPVRRVPVRAVVAVAALAGAGALAWSAPAGARSGPDTYRPYLQSQVQDASGAPKAGRDPAAQRQVPLSAAAARPHVAPKAPAARATGPRAATPVTPRTAGTLANGCAAGYGDASQCLPARAPGDAKVTCRYVVTIFAHGVRVTGADRLRLDSDHDGTACGPGDAGVPADAHTGMDMPGMSMP